MPKLSDTMEEGVLASWQAEEGDDVSAGDVIAQVETDKATMDLEVYDAGVLLKRMIEEGEAVPIGALIAVIGEEGEDVSGLLEEYGKGEEASEEKAEEAEEEEEAPKVAEEEEEPKEEEEAPARQQAQAAGNGRTKASPLARNMASEHGLDLASVEGSGPEGRIIKRDVEAILSGEEAAPASKERVSAGDGYERPAEVLASDELYETQSISQMRKTIARRLGESKFTAPHFYLTVDVDMAAAAAAREQLNVLAEEQEGPRISVNDLITKACAVALKKHPYVNASYLEKEGEIRFYNEVHVAVAVAVKEGLVTPVIRNADQKGLAQISSETRELAEKARNRELDLDRMEGSTFTTSNLGMYGIEEFTAIINPPNACILAIGAIREEAVVEEGEVVPGKRMRLTLSCDHRIVDGATGAEFLSTVRDYLEEPMSLLL